MRKGHDVRVAFSVGVHGRPVSAGVRDNVDSRGNRFKTGNKSARTSASHVPASNHTNSKDEFSFSPAAVMRDCLFNVVAIK